MMYSGGDCRDAVFYPIHECHEMWIQEDIVNSTWAFSAMLSECGFSNMDGLSEAMLF